MIPGLAIPRTAATRRRSLPRLPGGREGAGLQDDGENGFICTLWGMANGPTFVFIYILLQGDEPEYQLNTRRSHNNLQDTEAGREETMGEQTRYGQSYTFYIAKQAEHHSHSI